MIIPIRCFTCGKVIGNKWRKYLELLEERKEMADIFKDSGLPGMDAGDMQRLLADAQNNPQLMQQRMKEEFRHLSPEEQSRMLDALAATGLATREWWERFFRS